jgi:hypothetical protein
MSRSIHSLSTSSTGLSTGIKDNFSLLTSLFTFYPQKSSTPITTTFIYKYLSPQANLWGCSTHSFIEGIYAKLSNLGVVNTPTNEMRASA